MLRAVRYDWLLCGGKYAIMTCGSVPKGDARFRLYYYAYEEQQICGTSINQSLIENMNSIQFLIVQTGESGE